MDYKDYYQTLGVAIGAPQDEIKRAYRKLARKYHPDVSSESDAEERFKEVAEAYDVLKNPEKRAAYDQLSANWKAGQSDFQPPPDWNAGFEFHDINTALEDEPELVNQDPYGEGWLFKIAPENIADVEALLSLADYETSLDD